MQVAEAQDAEVRQPDPCAGFKHTGFFGRFYEAYMNHLHDTGESSGPAPAYRGVPPAVDSPPFPYSTWPMGGTPAIGYPDTRTGPLIDTLNCGPAGDFFRQSRIKIFGWLAPGFNISTSRNTNFHIGSGIGGNYPLAYDVYPNSIQLDQGTLYIERVPDSVQTDHVDWGFRLTNLFGTDYKYTFSKDIFSGQYLQDRHRYGYDPVMFYVDVYIPRVAEGLNIRVGRYISIPDIEAQLAPDNLMYSHSLLYSYDPYTQTGIAATLKLTKNWIVQLGFSGGNDVAPWSHNLTKPSPAVCLSWTSSSGGDNIYTCANTVNGGQYGYNNLNMFVSTWYHKFDDRWHIATEGWYMFQNQVPSVFVPTNHFIQNANGAVCDPGQIQCYAPEYAIVNYLLYKTSSKDYLGLRNEVFNDLRGQRTLFKTIYTSHSVAWVHWFGDVITIRPELRFEHSYATPAYDGGTKHNQFTAAADFVFHY
jgi:hypothetical protein